MLRVAGQYLTAVLSSKPVFNSSNYHFDKYSQVQNNYFYCICMAVSNDMDRQLICGKNEVIHNFDVETAPLGHQHTCM
jgi:hypothetical protein